MRMPGFTAEVSLYKMTEQYRITTTSTSFSDNHKVSPQLQRVKCSISGRDICCGVEDDARGMSFSLGCGRIL